MPVLSWYLHRLRAMEPGELPRHLQRKWWQWRNPGARAWPKLGLDQAGVFPKVSPPSAAPQMLLKCLQSETADILSGRWNAFNGLPLRVDDPPRWHKDYLAGVDLETNVLARLLNHRHLPKGADIKLIWELSRWYQLLRLAQAAYLLNDARAARKCLEWLNDWVEHNPPFRGWNWTSALESGLRLIQFTWIDALLSASGDRGLSSLRRAILPPHAEFTWRGRTFGSSANNHLLGELAGLIVATARWPELATCAAPLPRLQAEWGREVLAQFAEDGGNREQALNYQWFSWELSWVARLALLAANRSIDRSVEERLERAARFYFEVQVRNEPWDYGDSDNAYVAPFFAAEHSALREWRDWMRRGSERTAHEFWLNEPPALRPPPGGSSPLFTERAGDWWVYPRSGVAICESGFWFLRWDLSPLGYLKPAAHGHFDAQHLSIWYRGVALVIDPGTGAYYADAAIRSWLASRAAHNGPHIDSPAQPRRLGPFLWSHHHVTPRWDVVKTNSGAILQSELPWHSDRVRRAIAPAEGAEGWQVTDSQDGHDGLFTVRWQFAPETSIRVLGERRFQIDRRSVSMLIEVDTSWSEVRMVEREADRPASDSTLAGVVSPSFRRVVFAPYLLLTARSSAGSEPRFFRTTFLACQGR